MKQYKPKKPFVCCFTQWRKVHIESMNHTQVYQWIKECDEYLPEPEVLGSIKEYGI